MWSIQKILGRAGLELFYCVVGRGCRALSADRQATSPRWLLSGKGYSVCDKSANDDHQNHGEDEYAISDALHSKHSALRARS